jgi:hypothetical protein
VIPGKVFSTNSAQFGLLAVISVLGHEQGKILTSTQFGMLSNMDPQSILYRQRLDYLAEQVKELLKIQYA